MMQAMRKTSAMRCDAMRCDAMRCDAMQPLIIVVHVATRLTTGRAEPNLSAATAGSACNSQQQREVAKPDEWLKRLRREEAQEEPGR